MKVMMYEWEGKLNDAEPKKFGYFREDGKTYYKIGTSYTRVHDDNFPLGPKYQYYRCDKCKKLVSKRYKALHKCKRPSTAVNCGE